MFLYESIAQDLRHAVLQFHTDSEVGLGPLVAGLSLGSPALMHFRLLAKHTDPGSQRNIAISIILRHVSLVQLCRELRVKFPTGRRPCNGRCRSSAILRVYPSMSLSPTKTDITCLGTRLYQPISGSPPQLVILTLLT